MDPEHYTGTYQDVRAAGIDPVLHYIRHGGVEGRTPSARFDAELYLATNIDVRIAKANPLVHFITHGEKEGRIARPLAVRHADTWLPLNALGTAREYRPTYASVNNCIDDFHKNLSECPGDGKLVDIGIPGWLVRADAMKLYELAYFCGGDILEFGTNRGLSTFILAKAVAASGGTTKVVTMELSPDFVKQAESNLAGRSLASLIEFRVGDANTTCDALIAEGRTFSFAFVDHSHSYELVKSACEQIEQLLTVGSFVLFHDFNSPLNTLREGVGESAEEYGVYAGVQKGLGQNFEFYGIYGCCGLYRKGIA